MPCRGRADDRAELQLEVEAAGGREARQRLVGRLHLAPGPDDVGARDDDRRGAAVVADRDRQPVRRQRVLRPAEHGADVEGMVLAGIEVGVFRHPEGQVQRRRRQRHQMRLDGGPVGRALGEQRRSAARAAPPRPPGRRAITGFHRGSFSSGPPRRARTPCRLERGDVEHEVADGDAAARRRPRPSRTRHRAGSRAGSRSRRRWRSRPRTGQPSLHPRRAVELLLERGPRPRCTPPASAPPWRRTRSGAAGSGSRT